MSQPIWAQAMDGSSMAPIEYRTRMEIDQAERDFNRASQAEAEARQGVAQAQTRLNLAMGRQATVFDVYSTSGANRDQRAAAEGLAQAQAELSQATATKTMYQDVMASLRDVLEEAQADGTADARGATWSPYLQRLQNNPRIRQGLMAGYRLERDKADAANTPFNPRDYAIVGENPDGSPKLGRVWNMKLIQMAKEGLDRMLEQSDMRDPITRKLTKEGLAVDGLRRSLLAEGDRVNPIWQRARNVWADYSTRLSALRDGRAMLDKEWSYSDFAKRWNEAGESEREFVKIGMADNAILDIENARLNHDPASAIINTPAAQRKVALMFQDNPNPTAAQDFIDYIRRERTMRQTGNILFRGSQTRVREADDTQNLRTGLTALANAWIGLTHLKGGHLYGAWAYFIRAARDLTRYGIKQDPALNVELWNQLIDPKKAEDLLTRPPPTKPPESPRMSRIRRATGAAAGDIGALAQPGFSYSPSQQ